MSKKSKRKYSHRVAQQSEAAPRRTTEKAAAAATKPYPSGSRFSSSTEFNPDYAYVKSDLKRIGILAVSFFVILVVLSFFLR